MHQIESNYRLEELDLDILERHTSKGTDDGKVKPIWSLCNWNSRNKEYYEFEVLAERTGPVDEKDVDFDDVSSQTCYICNVNIPETFLKQHNKSFKHITCMKIADQALERIKKHMSQDVEDLPTIKTTSSYFCDPCAAVVRVSDKTEHEMSERHLNSVAHDKLLNNLLLNYLNKDNELIKINKSTMTTAEVEQQNDQTSETLPLDPNILICNNLSLKPNGMYYCNACNIHLVDKTVLHHVNKDSHKYNLTLPKSKHADTNANTSCKVEQKTTVKNDSIHYLMEYKGKINELLCKVCKVKVPSHIDNVIGHIRGSKHLNKYKTLLASNQLIERGAKYFCDCCLEYVDSTIVINHINSLTHTNSLLKVTENSTTGIEHAPNGLNSKIVAETKSNGLYDSIQSALSFVSVNSEILAKTENNVYSKTMADLEPNSANSKTTAKLQSNSVNSKMIAKTESSSVNSEFAEIKPNTINSKTIAKLEQTSTNSATVANIESNSGDSKTTFNVIKSCNRSESNANSIDEEDDDESVWHACNICNVFLVNNDSIIKSHYEGDSHKSRLEVTFTKKPKEILKKIHYHMQFTVNPNLVMCKICKLTVEFISIKVHRKSFDHKFKLISLLEENTIKKVKKMFFCQSCNTSFKKKFELIHIESLIHKHKLNNTKLSKCDDAFTSKSINTKMTIEADTSLNRNIDHKVGTASDAIEKDDSLKYPNLINKLNVNPKNNLISQLTNHPTSDVTKNRSDMSKKHVSVHKYTEPLSSTAFDELVSQVVIKYNAELNDMMAKIAKRQNDKSDEQISATDFHYLIERIPNSNQLMCKLCNVIVGHYTECVTTHIEGSKHKSKYKQMLTLNKLDKIDDYFYGCEVCKECITEGEEFDHINDNNHKTCLSLFLTGTEVAGGHFVIEITENQKELMCKACQVIIPRRITNVKTHLKSQKHISNYNSTLDANGFKKVINSFYCELCSISVKEVNIFEHINEDSHKCKITKIMPTKISTSLTTEDKLNKSVKQIVMDTIEKSFDDISNKNILKDIVSERPGSSGLNKVEYSKNNTVQNIQVSQPNSAERQATKVITFYYQIENTDNPKEVTCKVCKVRIPNTTVNITTHIGGLKHNSNYDSLLDANDVTKKNDNDILCCQICWVQFKGSGLFDHIYSDIHKKRMSKASEKENKVSDHSGSDIRKNETSHGNTKFNEEITKNKYETENVRKSKRDFSCNLLLETNEIEKYNDDLFDCKLCGRFFFTVKDVFNHIYSDIHKKNIKQKIANKVVGNSILDANGVKKYSNSLFDCEICNIYFFTDKVLIVHIYSDGHKNKIMQIAKVGENKTK